MTLIELVKACQAGADRLIAENKDLKAQLAAVQAEHAECEAAKAELEKLSATLSQFEASGN